MIFTKDCINAAATETVFGGASALEKVSEALNYSLTSLPGPDKIGQAVIIRIANGVTLVTWSNIGVQL